MMINSAFSNPYLWITNASASQLKVGAVINHRYRVISQKICQDIYPEKVPDNSAELPQSITAYLRLFSHRLHIPEVYDICQFEQSSVILLNNVPLDERGNLYPQLEEVWGNASALRQVYWLWQIFSLWKALSAQGVAQSLLVKSNLRVQGWRVRVLELYADEELQTTTNFQTLTAIPENTTQTLTKPVAKLQQLGSSWDTLLSTAQVTIAPQLKKIVALMQTEKPEWGQIGEHLNHMVLEVAAQEPLRSRVFGISDLGVKPNHNEDSCYPHFSSISSYSHEQHDQLPAYFSIVCDGLGGHEGGEVASQLAVQSMKLQVSTLISQINQQPDLMTPELVTEQLQGIVRVTNNVISARNDEQGRAARQRMATTLVMALQLSQSFDSTDHQLGNSHELYLVNVGDSRAYWLTSQGCLQLTRDDNVAVREASNGRSLYRQALIRHDGETLTQALGIRHADFLDPTVERLVISEDGLLILCSDGLSDNNFLERYWQEFTDDVLQEKLTLEAAGNWLLDLANRKNGHDNISFVITHYQISHPIPVVYNLEALEDLEVGETEINLETELDDYEPSKPVDLESTSINRFFIEFGDREEKTGKTTPNPSQEENSEEELMKTTSEEYSTKSSNDQVKYPLRKGLIWLISLGSVMIIACLAGLASQQLTEFKDLELIDILRKLEPGNKTEKVD